jgi:hypothetical protein
MSDPFDNPQMKAFLERSRREMFPKLKQSATSITILNAEPDPKLCVELGAAILFDKPIIVLVPEGATVPANLKRCAAAIIYGNPSDPATSERIQDALSSIMENDKRVQRKAETAF